MSDGNQATVVLFDFFGTLVTYEADRTALRYPDSHALVQTVGRNLSHDEFVGLWNAASVELESRSLQSHQEHSMLDCAEAFATRCEILLTREQCAELADTFSREWRQHVAPITEAAGLISDLGARYRLGVVSNTNDTRMVPELIAAHFPGGSFASVVLSVDHGHRKPHPSIYTAALTALGCEASEAVFVGDSYEADYLGPTDAGMTAYLIDPAEQHPIPEGRRLRDVADLRDRLLGRS